MLLNAIWSAPENVGEVVDKSVYVARSAPAAGGFLYGVGIMGLVILFFAVLSSLSVTSRR